uniref:Uncharacterized protein n=1 Tax=Odontella aurita TaxID=265563 RepID=A0A6U6GXT3_9STRA|mmetsp:Transcript_44528/g.135727  ORF Transcript_44528/g.135727 Transcript_44528/m.135727 type:complete len:133 (+) Transcript_44528:88-486(+)
MLLSANLHRVKEVNGEHTKLEVSRDTWTDLQHRMEERGIQLHYTTVFPDKKENKPINRAPIHKKKVPSKKTNPSHFVIVGQTPNYTSPIFQTAAIKFGAGAFNQLSISTRKDRNISRILKGYRLKLCARELI